MSKFHQNSGGENLKGSVTGVGGGRDPLLFLRTIPSFQILVPLINFLVLESATKTLTLSFRNSLPSRPLKSSITITIVILQPKGLHYRRWETNDHPRFGGDTFGATFANRYVGHYVITVRFGAGYLATISTSVSHRVSRRAKQTVR